MTRLLLFSPEVLSGHKSAQNVPSDQHFPDSVERLSAVRDARIDLAVLRLRGSD
jgi:hypothetical protein